VPDLHRALWSLLDSAGLYAASADIHLLDFAADKHLDVLEIGIPSPVGNIVCVAYPVPEHGPLPAYFASLGHIDLLGIIRRSKVAKNRRLHNIRIDLPGFPHVLFRSRLFSAI
jgi:hypothetical protein